MIFEDVLAAAQRAEPWAFEELFDRVAHPMVGFLRARGAEDAEGLANEALLRAFRGIAGFEGNEAQFRAWVFTITRNLLVDERRRRGRRPERLIDPAEMPDEGIPDETGTLVTEERVRALLDHLSPDQRDVVVLRIVGDLSIAETADVLGKTEGAVKLLQHRALAALRKQLGRPEAP